MKKIIICCLLCFMCFGFTACSPTITDKPNTEVVTTDSSSTKTSNGNVLVSDFSIEGVELDIGSSYQDVISKMKEPEGKGTFEAGVYLDYGDITFYTDNVDEKIARVSSIAIRGERKIGKVKVGILPSEIKNILGKPIYEGENGDKEMGGWVTVFEVRDRVFTAFSDTSNSAITTILEKPNSSGE